MSFIKFKKKVFNRLGRFIKKYLGENAFLHYYYLSRTRKWLHLNNPQTLNEKLLWLERYYRHPLIQMCSDKWSVRKYLRDKGCDDILTRLYGVYNSFVEIDFMQLPEKFAVKCNHGSTYNYLCDKKANMDYDLVKSKFMRWEKRNYNISHEWQYRNIIKKVIVEEYLEPGEGDEMIEYQVFCFNGEPGFFLARNDLGKNKRRLGCYAVSYSIDWKREYFRKGEEKYTIDVPKPYNYDKILKYAKILSADFPHVRVDFYEIGHRLVFGELTFSSSGGVLSNYKEEVINKYGKLLRLPGKYND